MANNRTVPTIGAMAAALFLTAAGVRASSVAVPMDIKPGSCPNLFKLDREVALPDATSARVLRVAILGTDVFDVNNVDVSTLVIFRADDPGKGKVAPLQGPFLIRIDHRDSTPVRTDPTVADVATPFIGPSCDCHDLGADGFDDLVLTFSSAELVHELDLTSFRNREIVDLCVGGELLDGSPFLVGDCIRLVIPISKRDLQRRGRQ